MAILTCVVALVVATGASAQQVITGTVVRIDPGARVVVLNDGRMYQTPANTVALVNGQPVSFTTIQPGTQIVLQSATPVILHDGRYVVINQPAPPATAITVTPGTTVIIQQPGQTAVTEPSASYGAYGPLIHEEPRDRERKLQAP